MQAIWSHGNERVQGGNGTSLAWDEEVPEKIRNSWLTFAKQLSLLRYISIPRHLFGLNDNVERIELHGYCDPSMGYSDLSGRMRASIAASSLAALPLTNVGYNSRSIHF